ncbi:MAG TPA: hypothetical protein VFL86_07420 [Burkholderiaceae bacterium]|nr:hypothetical protein [Burkholderiaceae bacterium]
MPAGMRKNGIKVCLFNAKPQLLHCNLDVKGSVDSCRPAHARGGIHEAEQDLRSFTMGMARLFQASRGHDPAP